MLALHESNLLPSLSAKDEVGTAVMSAWGELSDQPSGSRLARDPDLEFHWFHPVEVNGVECRLLARGSGLHPPRQFRRTDFRGYK